MYADEFDTKGKQKLQNYLKKKINYSILIISNIKWLNLTSSLRHIFEFYAGLTGG